MKKIFCALILLSTFALTSCSHSPANNGITIATATNGILKNQIAPFPVYLTNSNETRAEIEKKYSKDTYIVHTGHFLKSKLTREQNEKNLIELSHSGINLFNVSLEDLAIAEAQGIDLSKYDMHFLNSTVIDLTVDSLASGPNMASYEIYNGVAFIGLSDDNVDKKLATEKFLLNDYVLSILKVKKNVLKSGPMNSFIIIHTLPQAQIIDVMNRLPPSFINSLAD